MNDNTEKTESQDNQQLHDKQVLDLRKAAKLIMDAAVILSGAQVKHAAAQARILANAIGVAAASVEEAKRRAAAGHLLAAADLRHTRLHPVDKIVLDAATSAAHAEGGMVGPTAVRADEPPHSAGVLEKKATASGGTKNAGEKD